MANEITIRTATLPDARDLSELSRISLGYDYPADKTHENLVKILQNPRAKILAAECDRRVAGYIHGELYELTFSDLRVNVLALAVSPDFQRRGIGRALLTAMEAWAKKQNAAGIRLTSNVVRTGAHAFYKNCGYESHKTSKGFSKLF